MLLFEFHLLGALGSSHGYSSSGSNFFFLLLACQMSGIHATNNLYQRYGPKGFMEIKILQNDNLYVRVDLPGVPDDGVRHRVDSVRQKVVFFSGEETLSDGDDKKNARE